MYLEKEFIESIIDSLSEMIGFADDGNISRYDKEYSYFFEQIDKANKIIEKLNKLLESEGK
jgi:flagellin-specific chaperone FliS